MTLKKLQQYNGKNKNKAYVAYKGKIYDVSNSTLWNNGMHQGMHEAGHDLTQAMENAPHAEEVFAGFDVVDILDEDDQKNEHHIDWAKWYRKYHPHPMFVHFPIALHLFAVGLNLLFLFYQEPSFATAVFYSLFAATIMGIFAMFSGILSWWINYQMAFTHIFVIKLSLSIITLLLGIVAIDIYLDNPEVVYLSSPPSLFYHGTIFLTGITVIVLAYNGGKLTWPQKDSS
jgi:predicted heme/steroid binding protein/uncharacterized membrane protein